MRDSDGERADSNRRHHDFQSCGAVTEVLPICRDFPPTSSHSSGLGFPAFCARFSGDTGRRRGPSAFLQERAACPVGDVQPTTKRDPTNSRRWPAAAAPACPFVEIRMSRPTWERHRAALSALERGVSREASSADTSRFALGLAQDGLRPSWRDAPRAPDRDPQ